MTKKLLTMLMIALFVATSASVLAIDGRVSSRVATTLHHYGFANQPMLDAEGRPARCSMVDEIEAGPPSTIQQPATSIRPNPDLKTNPFCVGFS